MTAMRLAFQAGGQRRPQDILADIRKSKQAKKSPRMSGDQLRLSAEDIIAELREEAAGERMDSLVQQAVDDLPQLYEINRNIDQQFEAAANAAGLSIDDLRKANNIVGGDFQLVGDINANTPEALVVKYGNTRAKASKRRGDTSTVPVVNEARIHTQKVLNPVTGQFDVVPFVAAGESTPLVTHFGMVGKDIDRSAVEYMDSDEFLGKRILQLTGRSPVQNNDANKYAVDLLDEQSGQKVDVEMLKSGDLNRFGKVGFQVYTEMSPESMAGARPRNYNESLEIAREMAEELRPMVKQKLDQGMGLQKAIESLEKEGLITNSDGRYGPTKGKLLKEGGKYVDQLVNPVVSNRDAAANLANNRDLVMPLEGALLSDANAAKEYLEDVSGREAVRAMNLRPMPGNKGDRPSAKLYLNVPKDDKRFVTDLGELAPMVRQLFRTQ